MMSISPSSNAPQPALPGVTRLAPSPTGALHLGNARTFLANWALGRQRGWRIVMRMEDLDGPRIKPESAAEALELLHWLGIDWDGDVLTQSHDLEPYRHAMRTLCAAGRTYPCTLTRTEIEAVASAPQDGTATPAGIPRPDDAGRAVDFREEDHNYRLLVDDTPVELLDRFAGPHRIDLREAGGDFVVWTRRGTPAYQLSVVVDDLRQRVTDVVRGDDLLDSAARQTLLYNALGGTPPRWWHLPLVVGPDGRRLAKRHGDTRLSFYRDAGTAPERVLGLLAVWCGCIPSPREMTVQEFLETFEPDRIPRSPITFTDKDHAWLSGS